MKFILKYRVSYNDGIIDVYEHRIEASSQAEAKDKADSKMKEFKEWIGSDGRCSYVDLCPV